MLINACNVAGVAYYADFEVQFQVGHYTPLSRSEAESSARKLLDGLMGPRDSEHHA
jgi:hypothetical protein